MKVVLAGASGSGKTTLARALAAYFGFSFIENSAGLIMNNLWRERLYHQFGYNGDWGQRKVINESHIQPEFGREFQNSVLHARVGLANMEGNHIYDRSSLDPIVFYLNQVVHNDEQRVSEAFIRQCVKSLGNVDLILRIPLQNPNDEIENNESRVNNWFFQKKIDDMFDTAIDLVMKFRKELYGKEIKVQTCPVWDWDQRLNWARYCVNHFVLNKG